MEKCELCNSLANMYCESDEAKLCWDCDSRVHGANFLVAKHLRILLCHLCQSPTPWNGSGPKLGPIVSACSNCVNRNACREETNNNEETLDKDDDDDDDVDVDVDDDDDDGVTDDGDVENQVVPWSSSMPPVSSSSTSEEGASQSTTLLSSKRMTDHSGCSFSSQHQSINLSNETAFGLLKGQK